MEKSDLRVGMMLRHKKTGRVGEIRSCPGSPKGELGCAPWCVMVRTRVQYGKNKGKYIYLFWNLDKIEME